MNTRIRSTIGPLLALVAVLWLLQPGAALAERVERSGPAPADGRVTIENILGSLEIVGWDRDEIELTGTLGEDVQDLEFTTGSKSHIEVVYPRHADRLEDGADLRIHVPRDCRLDVEVVAADVTISGLRRVVNVTTVSGAVSVTGPCDALEVASVSGTIDVVEAGRKVTVSTVTGSAEIRGGKGTLAVDTVTAEVTIVFEVLDDARITSVGGTIDLTADLAPRADLEIDTINGDIVLRLADDVSADFDVTTFSGDIESAFGGKPRRTSEFVPGRELQFSTGSGEADVLLNTMSGSIDIRRR